MVEKPPRAFRRDSEITDMRTRSLALGLVVALAAAFSTPLHAADKETRQMMADIRMLQEQEQQIQTVLTTLTDQIRTMEKSVNQRIDDQVEAIRKGLADEHAATATVTNDMRSLRERLDDNTTRLGQAVAEIQALRQLITSRSSSSFSAPDSTSSAAPSDTVAPADAAASGESPTALFNSAYGDYASGQYDLAIEGFRAYLKDFPNGAQAPDAQVNICNAYIQDKKYAEAVDACDTAIRNYPKSSVAPTAYYRKGLAHLDLGQTDQARTAFDYIIKTWPDSSERLLAEQNEARLPATRGR
jgi:tol-pal system protein YbgF